MEYKVLLNKLMNGSSLSIEEAEKLALDIMDGNIPEVVIAAILIALRMKGETSEEIVGFARAMRSRALKIDASRAIDVVGTGGDGVGTMNVSTVSAILASILHPVAKHGNRAVSGRSGSADFLEYLGYKLEVEPDRASIILRNKGFVFLFAPLYHPAMKRVAPIRRTLGVRTIFNLLGPLTNPGGVRRLVVGVFSRAYAEKIAIAASHLDFDQVLVVNGEPGIDEASLSGETHIYEVRGSRIEYYKLTPEDFGLPRIPLEHLIVSGVEDSALRALRAARGRDREAALFIKMNTALALYVAGIARDYRDGVELADQLLPRLPERLREIIASNGDLEKLESIMVKAYGEN